MKRFFYSLILITALFGACKSEKERKLAEIQKVEESLFGDRTSFNDSIARNYLNLTDQYIAQFKGEEIIPELIFKQGEILNGLQNYSYAVRKFQNVYLLYPKHPKAAESIFICAFIYENNMQKYEEAGEYYKMFLKKYPNHQFANDAKIALANLGKTPEELVEEFERKAQDSISIQ